MTQTTEELQPTPWDIWLYVNTTVLDYLRNMRNQLQNESTHVLGHLIVREYHFQQDHLVERLAQFAQELLDAGYSNDSKMMSELSVLIKLAHPIHSGDQIKQKLKEFFDDRARELHMAYKETQKAS